MNSIIVVISSSPLIAPDPVLANGDLDPLRRKTFTQLGALNDSWEFLGGKDLEGVGEARR